MTDRELDAWIAEHVLGMVAEKRNAREGWRGKGGAWIHIDAYRPSIAMGDAWRVVSAISCLRQPKPLFFLKMLRQELHIPAARMAESLFLVTPRVICLAAKAMHEAYALEESQDVPT